MSCSFLFYLWVTIWINMSVGYGRVSFLFFFIVACIGTLLRSPYIYDIPVKITNLIHAHSHTAFQGWLYLILFILSTKLFLKKEQIVQRHYRLQFIITSFVILGILIAFALQGYAFYSILFSTLFQCLNYWYFRSFWLDTTAEYQTKKSISLRFMRTGILLGVLSTIAPIIIGVLAANGYKGTEIYESAIYYFLHFQYNGWFLFTTLGIFFKSIENHNLTLNRKKIRTFYRLMILAVFPGLTLSYLGMSFREYILPLAILATILELCALFIICQELIRNGFIRWMNSLATIPRTFMQISCLAFLSKIMIQAISLHPKFIEIAFHNRLSVIFYLHLALIGLLSFQIFAQMHLHHWIKLNLYSRLGSWLLIMGFITTEVILALGGIGFFYSHLIMYYSSGSMAIGIILTGIHVKELNLQITQLK